VSGCAPAPPRTRLDWPARSETTAASWQAWKEPAPPQRVWWLPLARLLRCSSPRLM
jgi:hypothetical protein